MAQSSEFVEFVLESLQPLRGVGARRMFGGWGIYKDGVMFALIAYDTLYFQGRRRQSGGLPGRRPALFHLYRQGQADPHALLRSPERRLRRS